ncbi:HNH endonuclease [Streptococcus mutans]|nr:HNH endonuclease [Streptococcus mutans]MCB5100745.1 HNH endonuclease [Streptococcus mutans]MCB5145246.1 HNH endonuclease [Streptococcus mutans]
MYTTDAAKRRFYNSGRWCGVNGLRTQALRRDNFECQMCKREGKATVDSTKTDGERKEIVLNVHHIQEIETHPELALDLNNLQTLCIYHHNVVHGKVYSRKINKWDDEKW